MRLPTRVAHIRLGAHMGGDTLMQSS